MKPFFALLLLALFLPSPLLRADVPSASSRDPRVVVPLLRNFHEHDGFVRVVAILGRPDTDIGSAFSITVFTLRDGTSVYVKATPSRNRIYYITRSAPGGLAETLYEPVPRILMNPPPSSAPF